MSIFSILKAPKSSVIVPFMISKFALLTSMTLAYAIDLVFESFTVPLILNSCEKQNEVYKKITQDNNFLSIR